MMRDNERKTQNYKEEVQLKAGGEIDAAQIKLEYSLLQRKYEILEEKEEQLHRLCASQAKKQNSKDLQAFLSEITKILNSKPKK